MTAARAPNYGLTGIPGPETTMTPARFILAVLVAAPLTASAGVVIEGKEGEDTSRILLEGQKLRMESGSGVMIFDGAT